jgi:lysozyme
MAVPEQAVELIKHFEGCKLKAYLCPAKVWTCGYGATGADVGRGTVWTQEDADDRLAKDLVKFERAAARMVRVPVTEGQKSALISLMYNIGSTAFQESTLLKLLNAKDYRGAGTQFLRWTFANGRSLNGLLARREAEKKLFMEGVK